MASLSLLQFACSDWVPFDFDIAIGFALAIEPLSAITLLARMFCRCSMAPLSAFKKERKKERKSHCCSPMRTYFVAWTWIRLLNGSA
jgi:hypothetical protein